MGRITSSFININTKFFKKFSDSLSVAAIIALAFNPLMPLVEFLPAQAVSTPDYTHTTTFTETEISNWGVDRSVPSGGYGSVSFGERSDVMEMRIDNTNENTSGTFYQTEGLKRSLPNETQAIKTDIFIDTDWQTKDVRAGLWGVGSDATGDVSAYPIVEFTTSGNDGHIGWRSYNDIAGAWTNHSTSVNWGTWNTVEIVFDHETTNFNLYINGEVVGANSATGSVGLSAAILNSYNYATDDHRDDYAVHWSSFAYGSATPDTTTTYFVNDPKYVRANNGGDLSAQLVTPDTTEDVQFYVNNDETPIPGNNVGGAGSSTDWWRLSTPLPAGVHVIAAEIKISGDWYEVDDTGVVYSLDTPEAKYIVPSAEVNSFRGSDNPIRVKVEDEFNQFKHMIVEVENTNYEVLREDCDLRQSGSYLLCDVETSATWLGLAEGTYTASTTTYTQANNRVDDLESVEFTIDNTQPSVTLNAPEIVSSTLPVEAEADDDKGVESVNFYVTEPRESDGVCTGNGTKLLEERVTLTNSDGLYETEFDVLNIEGEYCINATARDEARNNSAVVSQHVAIDNTNPSPATESTLRFSHSLEDAAISCSEEDAIIYTNTTDILIDWEESESRDVAYYWFGVDNANNTKPHHKNSRDNPNQFVDGGTAYLVDINPGSNPYRYTITAVDEAGNESEVITTCPIVLDQEDPEISITSVSESPISGEVTITGTASDNEELRPLRISFRQIDESNNVSSPVKTFTSNVDQNGEWSLALGTEAHPEITDGNYRIVARANDKTGSNYSESNTSADTVDVTIANPPGQPTNLQSVTTENDVNLFWDGVSDSDFDYYEWEVFDNTSSSYDSGQTSSTSTVLSNLPNDTYTWSVTAVDTAGNSTGSNTESFSVNYNANTVDGDEEAGSGSGDETDDNEEEQQQFSGQGGGDFAFNSQGDTAVPTVLSANTDNSEDDEQGEEDESEEEDGDVLQDQDVQDNDEADLNEDENEEDSNFWWWLLLIALLGGGIYAYARNRSDSQASGLNS